MTRKIDHISLFVTLLLALGCDNRALVGEQIPTPSGGGNGAGVAGGGGSATGVMGGTSGASGTVAQGVQTPGPGEWVFFDSLRGLNRDIYAIQPDGTMLRRVTTSPATEREPAVSPDGTTLAYSSDAGGTFQIYLVTLPGGAARQLTHEAAGAGQPAWSPDGSLIGFQIGSDHAATIAIIGTDGANERKVASASDGGAQLAHPSFKVDGSAILYDGYNQIHQVDLTSGRDTALIPGFTGPVQHPSPSPDGHLFAFNIMCEQLFNSIRLAPLASGSIGPCSDTTRVTSIADGYAKFPSFSRTGRVAVERGDGSARIGVFDVGGALQDVTHGEGDDRNPSWATLPM